MSERSGLPILWALVCGWVGVAFPGVFSFAQSPIQPSALSPQESLGRVVVSPNLRVELVAHEPNVIDPVAIRFDEEGRMWVVEMRDYPTGPSAGFPATSRISILRDRDNDGFYESATVFADKLSFATGLQPWKGGVFVTLAGSVAYLKDTDGDDTADINTIWYRGFAQSNTQLRANHPTLALDNQIYVAAGLRGGTITDPLEPDAKSVSISGMDFRFDPRTRKFDAVTGNAQFGLAFDDFGNRFTCANRDPAAHVVLENHHLASTPGVSISAVTSEIVAGDERTPLLPIARPWTTSNLHTGQFTAACGLKIFRGTGLPREYAGNVFVCEPTGYLVHRETIEPHGVTFARRPRKSRQEFFASGDPWCRPVNLELGPDGGLYVVDMYRQIIEHPEWMPAELRARPNLRSGNDRGRIYRVVSADFKRPGPPSMAAVESRQLVGYLAHPNAWQRETAARLILERQDRSIVEPLRQMALGHEFMLARIHALWLLHGLGRADDRLVVALCSDSHPRIVEHAIRVAEARGTMSESVRARIAALAEDRDARVRFQARLAARPVPHAPRYRADSWEEQAILIATGDRGGDVLQAMLSSKRLLRANVSEPKGFIARLGRVTAAGGNKSQYRRAVEVLLADRDFARPGLTGLLAELVSHGTSVPAFRSTLDEASSSKLDRLFEHARRDAIDSTLPIESRAEAIDLLATRNDFDVDLLSIATTDAFQELRLRAIAALEGSQNAGTWEQLLDAVADQRPAVQRAVFDAVLRRVERTVLLLGALESGKLPSEAIDPVNAKRLLSHQDPAIRRRAKPLLVAAIPADREQVLAEYRAALELEADPARGRGIFERQCSMCHRIGDLGTDVAPDISDARERTPLQLLTDIVQPNRAVDSNFFCYTATTSEGQVHSGILTAETATSFTLKQPGGNVIALLRTEVEDLRSERLSLMPEGLEKGLSTQDMADLISFIKNWRYLAQPGILSPARP